MKKEEYSKLTGEQKYFYLKGYLESFINNVSVDMGISENEVRKWLVRSLSEKINVKI